MKYALIWTLLLPCMAQEAGTLGFPGARGAVAPSTTAAVTETKPEDRGVVAGQVVNATTGEPIGKATLVLRRAEPAQGMPSQSVTVISDGKGMFTMVDVEPGKYRLSATRTGYLTGEYGARGPMRQGATLSIDKGQKLADLKIRMTPHAVITGRVVDEDGEPMANVQLQALRTRYMQGRKQLIPTGGASTNDLGEFRMFGVAPGRCYLFATSRGAAVLMEQPAPVSQGPEEVYPPTFYPSGRDIAEAIPLEIAPGSQITGIEFRLSKIRTVRVRGRVNNATGVGRPMIDISLVPRERLAMFGMNRNLTNDKGAFEIRGVTPGIYTLMATIYQEGGRVLSASQPVEVGDHNVEDLILTIGAGMEINGQVRVEGESAASLDRVMVDLAPRDSITNIAAAPLNERGLFNLKEVSAGRYDLVVARLPDGFYVKSIRVGQNASDIKTAGLDLTAGPPGPLDVVLSAKAGQLTGATIDEKSQPVAGATVVLIPDTMERRRVTMAYKTATTDQNGRFTLKNLDPGEYKIFAWEDIETGAYMDPDFVKPVESRGQSVTVRESSRDDLQVKTIPAE